MNTLEKNTLKLSGVAHTGGGIYENVKIEGVANINGDIECSNMDVQGVSSFSGNVACTKLHIEGSCKVSGGIKADSCKLAGLLNAGGDLEAESFTGSGSFQIAGALNAEDIDVSFVYGSSANEVCGQDIRIRKESHNGATEFIMDLIPWRHKGKSFRCNLIEGDRIDIEFVKAGTVRGKHVKIGPECKIELVEYHEEITIHPSAMVGKTVKLGE